MYPVKVLTDFSPRRYSDAELQLKAQLVIEKMTGNPHFPDPFPSLLTVKEATDLYAQSLLKSKMGNKAETSVKKTNRVQLQELLRDLARYVGRKSQRNEPAILSSGFGIRKTHERIGPLPQPTGFSVKYGSQSGSVMVRCDVIRGAVSYDFQYGMEPVSKDCDWQHLPTTKHTAKIEGLAKDRYYAFRVAGLSADPSRNYTDCISKIVV